MISESNNNYISLQEATEYCSYTQEYLSLRARQGKLKAVKIGRNWITKKEWVKEYIERAEEYNNNLSAKKPAEPPKNLPIEEKPIIEVRPPLIRKLALRINFGLVAVLVLVLLITGIAFGKESFKNVYRISSEKLPLLVQEFSQGFDRGVATIIQNSKFKSQNLANKVSSYTYIIGQTGDIIVDPVRDFVIDAIKKFLNKW